MIPTDREAALTAALERALPPVKQIYCLWHIEKNIATNFNGWLSRDEFNSFMFDQKDWIVEAGTEEGLVEGIDPSLQPALMACLCITIACPASHGHALGRLKTLQPQIRNTGNPLRLLPAISKCTGALSSSARLVDVRVVPDHCSLAGDLLGTTCVEMDLSARRMGRKLPRGRNDNVNERASVEEIQFGAEPETISARKR